MIFPGSDFIAQFPPDSGYRREYYTNRRRSTMILSGSNGKIEWISKTEAGDIAGRLKSGRRPSRKP
jgi:hypothetical protein